MSPAGARSSRTAATSSRSPSVHSLVVSGGDQVRHEPPSGRRQQLDAAGIPVVADQAHSAFGPVQLQARAAIALHRVAGDEARHRARDVADHHVLDVRVPPVIDRLVVGGEHLSDRAQQRRPQHS